MTHTVTVTPREGSAERSDEPYLWGRNRYARLARVVAHARGRVAMPGGMPTYPPVVSLDAYSKRGDESPCHLGNLSPADARAIAAALIAAADDAEKE